MEKIAVVNGIEMAYRECDVCGKLTHPGKLAWKRVLDHPAWVACPKCRKAMDDWKPLDIWIKPGDTTDSVPVKTKRGERVPKPLEARTPDFTVSRETGITLDEL